MKVATGPEVPLLDPAGSSAMTVVVEAPVVIGEESVYGRRVRRQREAMRRLTAGTPAPR